MIRLIFATGAAALLAGCANSSGVLKVGSNEFTVSTSASPGRGGVPAAKRIAYQEAAAECATRGLEVLALDETPASPTWTEGMARVDLQFKCVAATNSEVIQQRP